MATTGYSSTGAFFDTGIGICRIHGDIVYNCTRTNNTVTFTGTYARIKFVRESGSWTSFSYAAGWYWRLLIETGTQRASNTGSGTRSVNDVNNGSSVSFSLSVGANDTVIYGRIGAYFSGDGQTYTGNKAIDIPNLGSPSLSSQSVSNIKQKSADIAYSASAGSNATFSSCQLQYGLTGSYGTNVSKSSSSGTFNLTDLKPGKTYYYRFVLTNGGGKTYTSGQYTFETKPVAGMTPILMGLIGG